MALQALMQEHMRGMASGDWLGMPDGGYWPPLWGVREHSWLCSSVGGGGERKSRAGGRRLSPRLWGAGRGGGGGGGLASQTCRPWVVLPLMAGNSPSGLANSQLHSTG